MNKPLTFEEALAIIEPDKYCKVSFEKAAVNENNRKTYFAPTMSMLFSYSLQRDNNFAIAATTVAKIMGYSEKTAKRHLSEATKKNILTIVGKRKFDGDRYPTNIYKMNYENYNLYMDSVGNPQIPDIKEEDFAKIFKKMKKVRKQRDIIFSAMSDGEELFNKSDINELVKRYEEESLRKEEERLRDVKKKHKKYIDIMKEIEDYGLDLVYLGENKLRMYNKLCSTRNERNPFSTRPSVLRENLGFDSFIEHDTNASIHRVIYAMHHGGKSLSRDVDVYEIVARDSGLLKEGQEFTKEMREAIKLPMQCIQFRERAIGFWSFSYELLNRTRSFSSCKERDMFSTFNKLSKAYSCSVKKALESIAKSMHRFYNTDKFIGKDVFLYESDIHILVLKKFQDMGIKVMNVYDGFYFASDSGVTKDMFYDAIEEATMTVFNDMKVA